MTYTLNSGPEGQESNRLDFQHMWFKKFIPNLFPQQVSEHLSTINSPRIADMATGTGVWILEVAKQFPCGRLDGFDYDMTKFLQAKELPPNVTMQFGNVLETFPDEYLGVYDVVHVRFLMYALKANEWDIVVRNMMKLLKPGGLLFWEETGYSSWVTFPPSKAEAEILRYDMSFGSSIGRDLTQPIGLLRNFENAGFEDCGDKDYHSFAAPKDDGGSNRVKLLGLTQVVLGIVQNGGMEGLETEEDAERLIGQLKEDLFQKQIWSGFGMKWVWGRKPLLNRP